MLLKCHWAGRYWTLWGYRHKRQVRARNGNEQNRTLMAYYRHCTGKVAWQWEIRLVRGYKHQRLQSEIRQKQWHLTLSTSRWHSYRMWTKACRKRSYLSYVSGRGEVTSCAETNVTMYCLFSFFYERRMSTVLFRDYEKFKLHHTFLTRHFFPLQSNSSLPIDDL